MWISDGKWGRLMARLERLEKSVEAIHEKTGMSYYYGQTPYQIVAGHYGSYGGDFNSLPINKVVAGIAEHLGITYCSHPATEEFTTKKKC